MLQIVAWLEVPKSVISEETLVCRVSEGSWRRKIRDMDDDPSIRLGDPQELSEDRHQIIKMLKHMLAEHFIELAILEGPRALRDIMDDVHTIERSAV